MKSHDITPEQEKAFKAVVRAINRAKAKGLVFYGQQYGLRAMTKFASEFIFENGVAELQRVGSGIAIPYLEEDLLTDSGADDTYYYQSMEIAELFTDLNDH